MVSLEDRLEVVAVFKRGPSISTISKKLKLHRLQVNKLLKETGVIESCPRERDQKRSVGVSGLLKTVEEKLHQDPERSIRKLAMLHNISRSTMQRPIRDDLMVRLYPY